MYQKPRIGIDTIRFITTLTALEKLMHKLSLEYEKKISISLFNRFKKEVLKTNNNIKDMDFDLNIISISKDKSLLGYILVKRNYQSIKVSKSQKRAKGYKRELIFTSLNQPTKRRHISHIQSSYQVLKHFLNRFKVSSLDLCLDGFNNSKIETYKGVLSEFINFRSNIQIIKSSFYINNPINPNNIRFNFQKILIYDKYLKESKHNELDIYFKNWKRLETTIEIVNEKLNSSLLDDLVESIQFLSQNFYSNSNIDFTFLIIQQKKLGFSI